MPAAVPPLGSFWKQAESVFKVASVSRATDEVILLELETGKKYRERFATFQYGYQQVFKIGDVATWLNRTPHSIYRYERRGIIDKQKMYPVGGSRQLRFYTLDDVFGIHEMISQMHQGRPRKDGRVVNNSMVDLGTLKLELKERTKYD